MAAQDMLVLDNVLPLDTHILCGPEAMKKLRQRFGIVMSGGQTLMGLVVIESPWMQANRAEIGRFEQTNFGLWKASKVVEL